MPVLIEQHGHLERMHDERSAVRLAHLARVLVAGEAERLGRLRQPANELRRIKGPDHDRGTLRESAKCEVKIANPRSAEVRAAPGVLKSPPERATIRARDGHGPGTSDARGGAGRRPELVEPGMAVGLGTGSTVAPCCRRWRGAAWSGIRCVATSVATERWARELGIPVEEFGTLERLDIAIDGADQVAPDGWLIKGGSGAHLREKIVAAAAARFVVIVDSSKPVDELSAPVPLELFAFGLAATIRAIGNISLRTGALPSPDGGVLADYQGPLSDPAQLAARLDQHPGVAGHGLFSPPWSTT